MALQESKDALMRQTHTLRLLWWAFLILPVFYAVAGFYAPATEGDSKVVLGLALAAMVTFAMSILVRRLLLGQAMLRDREDLAEGRAARSNRLIGVMLVIWVHAESVGVFGLVARYLGADIKTMFAFIGLAILGMVIHRPPQGLAGSTG